MRVHAATRTRITTWLVAVWMGACLAGSGALSAHDEGADPYKGLSLASALSRLQQTGLRIVFSTDLVRPEMVVSEEPRGRWPREILDELLIPHGLHAKRGPAGTMLIIRAPRATKTRVAAPIQQPVRRDTQPTPIHVENIVVHGDDSASQRDRPEPREFLDRSHIETSPEFGSDPLLSVGRFAGVATTEGVGALNVRGGTSREAKIILDGLELYEPYHLKDRGGPISIINADAISGVALLNGAFPAEHGGHMSAVIEMATIVPSADRHGEIALSSDDVRIGSQGSIGDRLRWLVSARRGEAARLLDALGADPGYHPSYWDVSAKADYRLGQRTSVSFNLLGGDDEAEGGDNDEVINTVHQPGTFRARHTNGYGWITLKRAWTSSLFSQTVFSKAHLLNDRIGSSPRVTFVKDVRAVGILGVKQDWLKQSTRHLFKWGIDFKHLRADYTYASSLAPGVINLSPRGNDVGLYVADRFRVSPRLNIEMGLRWDRQTYVRDRSSALAPRINAVYAVGDRTALRFGWGHFYQPQKIHELHVEDGVHDYHVAERAEHRVLSLAHELENGLRAQVSVYQKRMTSLAPRYENLFEPLGFFPEAETDRVRIVAEAGRAEGLELAVRGREEKTIGWWAAYSAARAEDQIEGAWVARSWDQRHAFDVGVDWKPRPEWLLAVAGSFHSGRSTTPITASSSRLFDGSPAFVPHIGARNSERLPPYSRIDVRVSRSIRIGGSDLKGVLTITDALDRENVCCVAGFSYLPQADGSVLVQRHHRQGLPRLVTLGVTWKF